MKIRIVNENDYTKLRGLWQEVFGDSTEFIDSLYEKLSATGYVLVDDEEDVKSCLTVFDVGTYHGKVVSEIYAVCTGADAREKGYASRLVEFAKRKIVQDGKIALICPAEESLVSFYEKLGFEPHFFVGNEPENIKYSENVLGKVPHISLNYNFMKFILEDDPDELMKVNLGGDIIQGMINADSGIKRKGCEYPYFGFPMK